MYNFPVQSAFAEQANRCLPKVLTGQQPMIMKVNHAWRNDVLATIHFTATFGWTTLTMQLWPPFFPHPPTLVSSSAGLGSALSAFPLTTGPGLQSQPARSVSCFPIRKRTLKLQSFPSSTQVIKRIVLVLDSDGLKTL